MTVLARPIIRVLLRVLLSLTLTECIVQHLTAKVASSVRVPLLFVCFSFSNLFVFVTRGVEMFIERPDCPDLKQTYLFLTDTSATAALKTKPTTCILAAFSLKLMIRSHVWY